jgi:hypothetical protein
MLNVFFGECRGAPAPYAAFHKCIFCETVKVASIVIDLYNL